MKLSDPTNEKKPSVAKLQHTRDENRGMLAHVLVPAGSSVIIVLKTVYNLNILKYLTNQSIMEYVLSIVCCCSLKKHNDFCKKMTKCKNSRWINAKILR